MKENQYIVGRNVLPANHEQLMNRSLNSGKKRLLEKNLTQLPLGSIIRLFSYPSLKPVLTVLGIMVLIGLTTTVFAQTTNQSLQNQINELQQTLSNWKTTLLAVGIGLGAISTVLVLYFNKSVDLKKREKEIEAEQRIKQMEEKVIEGINDKATTINLVLDKTDEEQVLLKTKRIYLWGETNLTTIRKVLRIIGFKIENLITDEQDPEAGYDVLFINNERGNKSPKKDPDSEDPRAEKNFTEIIDLINRHKDKEEICIFYYNTNQIFLPLKDIDFDLQHRINFATNPSQIYGNLVNTLKYQDRLKREKA